MPAPVLLRRDEHLLVQLGDVAEPDLRAFARGSLGDRARERVHVPRGAVDDPRRREQDVRPGIIRAPRLRCAEFRVAARRTGGRCGGSGRVATPSATASQIRQRGDRARPEVEALSADRVDSAARWASTGSVGQLGAEQLLQGPPSAVAVGPIVRLRSSHGPSGSGFLRITALVEVMLIARTESASRSRLEWTLASRVCSLSGSTRLRTSKANTCARCFTTSPDAESICLSYRDFGRESSRAARHRWCR